MYYHHHCSWFDNLYIVFISAILATALSSGNSRPPHSPELERELDIQLNLNLSSASSQSSPPDYASVYGTVDKTNQGFVNLGALQSFTLNLTAQEKADVIDSVLFAQLTASHMYDRETNYTEWYNVYVQALTKLGWMVDSYHYFEYHPPNSVINLATATLKLLRLLCIKPIQLKVIKQM